MRIISFHFTGYIYMCRNKRLKESLLAHSHVRVRMTATLKQVRTDSLQPWHLIFMEQCSCKDYFKTWLRDTLHWIHTNWEYLSCILWISGSYIISLIVCEPVAKIYIGQLLLIESASYACALQNTGNVCDVIYTGKELKVLFTRN